MRASSCTPLMQTSICSAVHYRVDGGPLSPETKKLIDAAPRPYTTHPDQNLQAWPLDQPAHAGPFDVWETGRCDPLCAQGPRPELVGRRSWP